MAPRATVSVSADTLTLSGVLDFDSVLDVDLQGQRWLQGPAATESTVNLSGLSYSSSVGIALLLGWLRVAQQHKKKIRIVALPGNLAALANVGGLNDFL